MNLHTIYRIRLGTGSVTFTSSIENLHFAYELSLVTGNVASTAEMKNLYAIYALVLYTIFIKSSISMKGLHFISKLFLVAGNVTFIAKIPGFVRGGFLKEKNHFYLKAIEIISCIYI